MKKWYLSKTFWVNFLTLIVGLVTVMTNSDFVAMYPQVVSWLVAVLGGVNVLLRFVTDSPITKIFLTDDEQENS